MKKYLLCLMAVVTFLHVDAAKIENGVLYLYGKDRSETTFSPDDTNFSTLSQIPGYNASTVSQISEVRFIGDFTDGWSSGWLVNSGSNELTHITKIDMSLAVFPNENSGATGTVTYDPNNSNRILNVSYSPSWRLNEFDNLEEIVWPTKGNIGGLPSYAFSKPGCEEIRIPAYIKYISDHAFDYDSNTQTHTLNRVYFEKDENETDDANSSIYLGLQAFSNCYALTDVYIETMGSVAAANNAFPHFITYGHSDVNRDLAVLHFPAEKADYYVNKNHPLKESDAANDHNYQIWLNDHYSSAGNVGNGFYEFVSNGINIDEDWGEVTLRTFSDANIDYAVGQGAKAYVVSDITPSGSGDSKTFSLTLKRVNVIPYGTGVILFGGSKDNGNGRRSLDLMAVNYTKADGVTHGDPFTRNSSIKNLLVGTAKADGSKTHVDPYEEVGGSVAYRNFGMGKFSSTDSGKKYFKEEGNYGTGTGLPNGDFVGFFRLKPTDLSSGKAYLRLEAGEYDRAEGGEVIVVKDDNYDLEYAVGTTNPLDEATKCSKGFWYKRKGDTSSKITWEGSWGTRQMKSGWTMANYMGEPEDEATLILPASALEVDDNGEYFNLNGMKVTNPSKGVYIHNGKKIVVK